LYYSNINLNLNFCICSFYSAPLCSLLDPLRLWVIMDKQPKVIIIARSVKLTSIQLSALTQVDTALG